MEAASEYDDPDLMADVLDDIARSKAALGTSAKWAGPYGPIGAYIREESKKSLESYRNQPNNLREDANQEENTARGGYANRQLFELVQNSADSLAKSEGEYIWVRLTPTHLYCADNGRPIDKSGARALLFSHLSLKRGTDQIGVWYRVQICGLVSPIRPNFSAEPVRSASIETVSQSLETHRTRYRAIPCSASG